MLVLRLFLWFVLPFVASVYLVGWALSWDPHWTKGPTVFVLWCNATGALFWAVSGFVAAACHKADQRTKEQRNKGRDSHGEL